ncbi:MAG: transcriptional repressor [Candidatus Margulisbacteria bacterium]|nr:transcriptional repressor [Candidatus Margulisiibacteriota bacterium]
MKNHHTSFETYLTDNDGRYTEQKRCIVDEIFKIQDHFEVESFIDSIRQNHHKFSRATVYRTIKQLLDAGLIQKISTRDGKIFYEHNFSKKQHDHLICNSCGKILEIKEDSIDTYLEQFCKELGFHTEYRSLHLYGQCQQCFDQQEKES